jgi:hypothetical protein
MSGLELFEKWLDMIIKSKYYCYGPLEYKSYPRRVSPQVAMAIVLADVVTRVRRDLPAGPEGEERSRTTPWSGGPFRSSSNLPWKAIAEFISADLDDPEDRFTHENIQIRAETAAQKVTAIHHRPRFNL